MQVIKDMYFTYSGRLNRWRYFSYGLIVNLPYALLSMILYLLIFSTNTSKSLIMPLTIVYTITTVIMIATRISLMLRRLHDMGVSAWFMVIQLLGIIPGVGFMIEFAYCLIILFVPGTKGANKYGDDPLQVA